MGLIFTDIQIFKASLFYYDDMMKDDYFKRCEFNFNEEELDNRDTFNLILSFGYFRYLIEAFIFIIQCDYSGFFDNKGIEKWLLKAYRRYGFAILTAIYDSFDTIDMLHTISKMLLDDVCTYTASTFKVDRINDARAIASALSRDVAIPDFSQVIDKICESAIHQWEGGSTLDHISMLKTFKKNWRYAKYFGIRGFERQLKLKLLDVMRAKGLHFILGEDVFKGRANRH